MILYRCLTIDKEEDYNQRNVIPFDEVIRANYLPLHDKGGDPHHLRPLLNGLQQIDSQKLGIKERRANVWRKSIWM